MNLHLVRRVLKEKGQATKRELAQATGLSAVTVGTLLQDLTERGEVQEAERVSSGGGRPAQLYAYNPDYALALILFPYETKGDTRIRSTVVNLSGKTISETDARTEKVDVQTFETLIDVALAAYPAIGAIGFGLPGAEYEGRMMVSDYDALRGVALTEHFRERYGKPVVVENDVNAAVLGFWKKKGVAPDATGVYLYIPDRFAPGAGIVIQGKLFKGKRGFAGEVATIPLGIPWGGALLRESVEARCEAAARLTAAVCSVLNPDFVVLNASFLGQAQLPAMMQGCSRLLPPGAVPQLSISEDFTADYVDGMIVQTLSTLEPGFLLSKYEA
ncbi:ROK family transcriptional regulator [Paenibacillus caseinilyticus]|uniref:ROK family transcriptional regulator n=1 Tax=Paenibacillus caseinilyticus TaxID=3098138 RepID=UPI0022B926D3|nr:ROK family transcriptional regulator [Paenibacillus caseinilyticus]MCZ8520839.1 ROK family protein [Paenibacillus caseinilyticus]